MKSKKNSIIIRKATISDSKEIAKLNFLIIDNDFPKIIPKPAIFSNMKVSPEKEETEVKEQIEDPDYEILVATIDCKIVGVLVLCQENYSDELAAAPFTTIENMLTHPAYRHLGIGLDLLREAEKIALSKNHQFIDLLVWSTNLHAIALYNKCGFTTIESRMLKKIDADSLMNFPL